MLSASRMVALGQVCIKKPCGVEPSPHAAAEETEAFWEQRSSNKQAGGAEPGVLSCCNPMCGLSCRARKAPAACGAWWGGHCMEIKSFWVSRVGPRPCSSYRGRGDHTWGPAAAAGRTQHLTGPCFVLLPSAHAGAELQAFAAPSPSGLSQCVLQTGAAGAGGSWAALAWAVAS